MRSTVLMGMVFAMLFVVSCNGGTASQDGKFETFAKQFIEDYLRMNPEAATVLGDHRYDGWLDDRSAAGVAARLAFNKEALKRLKAIDKGRLSETNRIDYEILRNEVEGTIFSLEELREYEWNPLTYNVGGAIYYLIARDFAPIEERVNNVGERLKHVREVAAYAKANLKNPPKVHTETAIQQNEGTISLIRDQLDMFLEDYPEMKQKLKPLQEQAVDALTYYGSWLERDLLPVSNGDFRIGADRFRRKLKYVLDSDFTVEEVLQRAQDDLTATQNLMYETALPLYREYFPGKDAAALDKKRVIKAVLDKLAEDRPDNDTIVERAGECLERAEVFTRDHKLVTMPDKPVDLIVMPEFQRGVAVAYCDAPGPLEPEGKTFFAISPTPKDWSAQRVESFFREYNEYMLEDLTIHEAMPGHYLQLAHSNAFKAPTMIRAIFYSGPFVEGWATYAEQFMAENGYGGPEVRMEQLKMRLRLIINAIIDQKIHTAGMTEKEAIDLMINEGFQEEGEASGKWRRACLTSTQLSTYYVGNIEMNDIRDRYIAKNGPQNPPLHMHDEMLSFGSPPPRHVKTLLGL